MNFYSYIDKELSPIPIVKNEKRPAITNWTRFAEELPTRPDINNWPSCIFPNIGPPS